MATPNAAGAAAMIREYLEEIALRAPRALVKALLILGAEDVGSRDIPTTKVEGESQKFLAPPDGQGVRLDDSLCSQRLEIQNPTPSILTIAVTNSKRYWHGQMKQHQRGHQHN